MSGFVYQKSVSCSHYLMLCCQWPDSSEPLSASSGGRESVEKAHMLWKGQVSQLRSPERTRITSAHILFARMSHMAVPGCKGGWEMLSLAGQLLSSGDSILRVTSHLCPSDFACNNSKYPQGCRNSSSFKLMASPLSNVNHILYHNFLASALLMFGAR